MNRRIIAFVLILLFSFTVVSAAKPSERDILIAITAISDATIANVAAFLNTPTLNLPGSTFEKPPRASLPVALELTNADLGSYRSTFHSITQPPANILLAFLQSAKGPLNDLALQFLDTHDWQEKEVVLSGRVSTDWGAGVTLTTLMGKAITNAPIDPIEAHVDVVVRGSRLSMAVAIRGSFLLFTNQEGYFVIEPRQLTINGE
ncbi:MAG: hypothetical protein WC954_06840 [Sphaerochaeta sp.]